MRRTVIFDNASLVNLTHLHHFNIFQTLRSIFDRVHIPSEIKVEYERGLPFEPDRAWLLRELDKRRSFFSYCIQFDSVSLDILKSVEGIDAGEAAAAAQYKVINAHYIISDDLRFTAAIREHDKRVRIYTTLHVIAMLDINQLLADYDEIIRTLHVRHPFTSNVLRTAYKEVIKELGLPVSKTILNKKCSFKHLKIAN